MFEFIEAPLFTSMVMRYLADDEYARLQDHLNRNPLAGDVVSGSGGVRKMRWMARNRGKRGGIRVIYFVGISQNEIWMLTLYGKETRNTIPANVLRKIKEAIENA